MSDGSDNMMTPMKILCKKCGKIEHEDIYEMCWKCTPKETHGNFKATKEGLMKVADKPIKITTGDKTFTIQPDNPFYETVLAYDDQFKSKNSEGYGSAKDWTESQEL